MASLRLLAITSNLTFIVYAVLAGLHPVLLLHALLLPTNIYRLTQGRRGSATSRLPLEESHHDTDHPELRARIE